MSMLPPDDAGLTATHTLDALDMLEGTTPGGLDEDEALDLSFSDDVLRAFDAAVPALPEGGRVGILGGSFNPPHLAHALLALSVLATEPLDGLWVLPCADHPFGKDLAPLEHRVRMCEHAFSRLSAGVKVVDAEKVLPTPSYTVKTLAALHAVRPGIQPSIIIGTDILMELHRWKAPTRLRELARLLVVPRQGFPRQTALETYWSVRPHLGFSLPEVASRTIRKQLRQTGEAGGFLDQRVVQHIREAGLYGARPLGTP